MEMWPEQVVGFDWNIDYNDQRCCETGVGDGLQMLKKIPSVYEVGSGISPVVCPVEHFIFCLLAAGVCLWYEFQA